VPLHFALRPRTSIHFQVVSLNHAVNSKRQQPVPACMNITPIIVSSPNHENVCLSTAVISRRKVGIGGLLSSLYARFPATWRVGAAWRGRNKESGYFGTRMCNSWKFEQGCLGGMYIWSCAGYWRGIKARRRWRNEVGRVLGGQDCWESKRPP
jgi:hypothetical protein